MSKPVRYNVQLQTTSVCNGSCIICPYPSSWHKQNPGRMSDELFERILDQLSTVELGKVCPYLENEPLMDPDFLHRLGRIAQRLTFDQVEISTNAQALTPNLTDALAEQLQHIPHRIWISFHGCDRRTHEGMMGLDHEVCMNNITHLLVRAQEQNLDICIRGAGMGRVDRLQTAFDYEESDFRAFWEAVFDNHGFSRKPRLHYFTYHDRCGNVGRGTQQVHDTESSIVRPDLSGFTCDRVENWLHFLYTGELVICCMDYMREEVFADIRTTDLKTILESGPNGADGAYARLQRKVRGLDPTPHDFLCKRCISPGG